MSTADIVVRFLVSQVVSLFQRELEKPDRWEADPKTKTIRRRRPRGPERVEVKPETSKPPGSHGEVIDVCPWCFHVMPKHGPGGKCPTD